MKFLLDMLRAAVAPIGVLVAIAIVEWVSDFKAPPWVLVCVVIFVVGQGIESRLESIEAKIVSLPLDWDDSTHEFPVIDETETVV